jgi:hypothetical protein
MEYLTILCTEEYFEGLIVIRCDILNIYGFECLVLAGAGSRGICSEICYLVYSI